MTRICRCQHLKKNKTEFGGSALHPVVRGTYMIFDTFPAKKRSFNRCNGHSRNEHKGSKKPPHLLQQEIGGRRAVDCLLCCCCCCFLHVKNSSVEDFFLRGHRTNGPETKKYTVILYNWTEGVDDRANIDWKVTSVG